MPPKRLLSRDPAHGVTQYYHAEADGSFLIETQTDVTDLVEANKVAANADHGRWGEWAQVARYPLTIWLKLKEEGILADPKAYRKWLNDPDNRAFRTRPGKV